MTAARIVHLTLPPYLHVRGEGRTSMKMKILQASAAFLISFDTKWTAPSPF